MYIMCMLFNFNSILMKREIRKDLFKLNSSKEHIWTISFKSIYDT